MQNYDVVIIGGGPVGVALAIELGVLNIKTAIIEKHAELQQLPRAQLLNPRSMEFFRRWGISEILKNKRLLPPDYPLRSIWCSGLSGEMYSSITISENIAADLSPENYVRIPLWITESVLRQRIKQLPSVSFYSSTEALHIEHNDQCVILTAKNRLNGQQLCVKSSYMVGCDGANSITRELAGIKLITELPETRMINIVFRSEDLNKKMTMPKGILYYNLSLPQSGALGCIDLTNHLWYALISCPGTASLDQIDISDLLDQIAGFSFKKDIVQQSFWMRKANIAENFNKNRLFLAGDAAHILPPNGGHGLNTGLGDSVNLAWKLAAVIHRHARAELLDTYHTERYPTALRAICLATKNALDAAIIYNKFPPHTYPKEFAAENIRLSQQHSNSLGLSLGYHYAQSPIIMGVERKQAPCHPSIYTPRAIPGAFAPHVNLENGSCLYDSLTSSYTLLITKNKTKADITSILQKFMDKKISLHVFSLNKQSMKKYYTKQYYLLRPDWHIAWCGNSLPADIEYFMKQLMMI